MADDQELYRVLSDAWEEAMDKEEFRHAIGSGIAAYLALYPKNEKLADGALGLIHVAINQLFSSTASTEKEPYSCSFCGQSGSETRLGAGPDVFICIGCVELFNEIFGIKAPSTPAAKKPNE